MQKIKLLPEQEILRIAAGQVVDRPANVVKELVENSIDAGATQITVYLEDGGKDLIQVVDNGCGMSKKDAKLCFQKHTTSKITSLNDLDSIATFGFRGEALASISSVSKVTLKTKEKDMQQGLKFELEDGKFTSEQEISFSQGTDLAIKNLFYNTPARQKFLKKRETENRHITQLFQAFCLSYLDIHFKLFVDGRQTIQCPPTNDIIKRSAQLWGHNFAQNMIPVETKKDEGKPHISGAISNHQYFRYDRGNIFLFVNNRWVKNYEIQRALLKGYINVLPPARYPAAFIFVQIDPSIIDINIHPRKEEVKFLHPRTLTNLLQPTVKKALENHLSNQINPPTPFDKLMATSGFARDSTNKTPTAYGKPMPGTQDKPFQPFNFDTVLRQNANKPSSAQAQTFSHTIDRQNIQKAITPTIQEQSPDEQKAQTEIAKQQYEIIGQFKKTYILIEKADGLFLVDQHAAHERVLYEIFSKRFEDVATVKLLFPTFVTLKQEEMELLEPHLHIFKKNGIDAEPFGENQLKIQATPVHIKNIKLDELAREVISWIKEFQDLDEKQFFKKINERMHAQMSCKAAVKAGDTLTFEQMEKLLRDLEKTENRFACPHGRPTGWILTTYEIEKKFKRKL